LGKTEEFQATLSVTCTKRWKDDCKAPRLR
jgi:hypothetical protein